ncbi:MAG: hypothetical protein IKA89_07750 [Anaerotignum sp.]|nr:hypothetical protein [Anaerotignum sp.]
MTDKNKTIFYEYNVKNIRDGVLANGKRNIRNTMKDRLEKSGYHYCAADVSRRIDVFVIYYEQMAEALIDEPALAMEEYFEKLKEKSGEKRLRILQEIDFGLQIFSDDFYIWQVREEETVKSLYKKYARSVEGRSAEELEREICKKVERMRLSPKALSRLEKALTKGTSPVLTAAAIGRESHDIKCMAALELFLESDGQMDAVEAAYIACNAMQMQAVADAVHRGVIVEKAATALIIASVIAAILIIAYYFPPMLELYHAIGELALPSATNVLAQTLEANAAAMGTKMMIGVGGLAVGIELLRKLPNWMTGPHYHSVVSVDMDGVRDGFRQMMEWEEQVLREKAAAKKELQQEESQLQDGMVWQDEELQLG